MLVLIVPAAVFAMHKGAAGVRHKARHAHQSVAVTVAKARQGTATSDIAISGLITAQRSINLAFGASGRLASIDVKVGQTVTKGQVLAALGQSVANAQMAQSQAAVAVSEAKLTAAKAQASQSLLSAQHQVDRADAALKQASASVAMAETKQKQVQAGVTTSGLSTLEATIAADQQTVKADEQQVTLDQTAITTANDNVTSAEQTQSQDETLYGTTAAKYQKDEQAYQTALENYRSWSGYGQNPYQTQLTEKNTIAQQAESAYKTLQTDASAVTSAKANASQAQKALTSDQGQLESEQAKLTSVQNQLASTQSGLPLTVQAANDAVSEAKAAEQGAEVSYSDAKASAKASQELYSSQATLAPMEAAVTQAKAAQQVLTAQQQHDVLTAPFGGTITSVPGQAGAEVASGTTIAVLQGRSLTFQAAVPQTEVSTLKIGDAATIAITGQTKAIAATVVSIAPAASPQSLTFAVILAPTNGASSLRAGAFASATIVTNKTKSAVLIPSDAIVTINGPPQVFVVQGHKVRLVSVTPSLTDNTVTEVSGIKPGTQVVTAGQTYLTTGDHPHITGKTSVPSTLTSMSTAGFASSTPLAASTGQTSSGRSGKTSAGGKP